MARTRPSAQEGFTLVEVLVAALVLVVGGLTAFRLVDAANATTSVNSARIGATNLEREIGEYARGTDYDQLQPTTLVSALRQRAAIAGTGTPWTITRRGVNYTVTASVCTFDDPKDGLAAAGSPPSNPCPAAAADPSATNPDGTAKVDQNPDDFRRVTVKLDWRVRARTGTMTQASLVVNPAGGLGPRITAFDEPTQDVTGNSIAWGGAGGLQLSSTSAAGVHWTTSDGKSQGDAGGGPTSWNFSWDLGPDKSNPLIVDGTWVLDGDYTVQAQAVDSRGAPGEARIVTIHINRHPPGPVQNLDGGYDTRFSSGVVDLKWSRYPENDVQGYRVYRDGSTLVCPSDGSSFVTSTSCTDTNPGLPGTLHTYTVKAFDCGDLLHRTNCDRAGAASTPKIVALLPGVPLSAPTNVTMSIVDGQPRLDWTGVTGASFYRIYRDTGTTLGDRYDQTITSSPTYTDPSPGSGAHTYWVTAIGSTFDESAPSSPVTSP
jgi:type II secretory pathway pseudopilin PulG